jgi:hypothetical protein
MNEADCTSEKLRHLSIMTVYDLVAAPFVIRIISIQRGHTIQRGHVATLNE